MNTDNESYFGELSTGSLEIYFNGYYLPVLVATTGGPYKCRHKIFLNNRYLIVCCMSSLEVVLAHFSAADSEAVRPFKLSILSKSSNSLLVSHVIGTPSGVLQTV